MTATQMEDPGTPTKTQRESAQTDKKKRKKENPCENQEKVSNDSPMAIEVRLGE